MRVPRFEYIEPQTVEEACSVLAEHKAEAKIIAGGTDTLVMMKQRIIKPRYLVNIKRIKEPSLTYAADCGTAINPMRVEGQMEGSIHLGLGMALSEQMLYENGQTLNASFLDYKLPTPLDMPDIQGTHIEPEEDTSGETGPFGDKEAGEGAAVAVAPAIINALYDATGVRFKELPVTPEKVLKALEQKQEVPAHKA